MLDFLTGAKWKPGNDIYSILPMILGNLYITAGAVVIGVPIGLLVRGIRQHSTVEKAAVCSGRAPSCWPVFRPSYTASSAWSLSTGSPCGGRRVQREYLQLVHSGGVHRKRRHYDSPTIIGVSETALRAVPMSHCERCRRWAHGMGVPYSRLWYRLPSPACWLASCSASAAPRRDHGGYHGGGQPATG